MSFVARCLLFRETVARHVVECGSHYVTKENGCAIATQ
jgi:hypothetical protein